MEPVIQSFALITLDVGEREFTDQSKERSETTKLGNHLIKEGLKYKLRQTAPAHLQQQSHQSLYAAVQFHLSYSIERLILNGRRKPPEASGASLRL